MHLMTCMFQQFTPPVSTNKRMFECPEFVKLDFREYLHGKLMFDAKKRCFPWTQRGRRSADLINCSKPRLNPPTKQRIQHVTSGHWKSSKLIGNDIDYIEILNHRNSVGHSYNLCIQDYPRTSSADLRPRWSSVEWQEFGQQHLKPRCHDRATEHCHVGWPRWWFLWNGWKMLEINMEFWSLAMEL